MRNAIGYGDPDVVIIAFLDFKIPTDAKVLDIACGSGLVVRCLAEKGYRNFDGIDASQKMLDKAKTYGLY